jgi:stage V sporulation protein R
MKKSKMLSGSPILVGDNNVPGLKIHKEVLDVLPQIESACKEMGLDYYPIIVEFVRYDEMAELASYGGFPVRYPHWKFGMEYEEMARGYEHNQYRISEMVVNCLHPSTRVITNSGTKKAVDVKVGDILFAGEGKLRNVVAVVKQPAKVTTRIKVRGFGEDIICSDNHKWLVLTSDGFVWKEAKNLENSDVLVGSDTFNTFVDLPANLNCENDFKIENSYINSGNQLTLEIAELLGVFIGDTSSGIITKENSISVVVDKKLFDYKEHIKSLFFKVFKTEPIIQNKELVDVITVNSQEIVDFFEFIGYKNCLTQSISKVPSVIWSSSHEYRAAFLKGLFDTDRSSAGFVSFSSYSHEFVCDVQLLLREMGIASTCFKPENSNNEITILRIQGRGNLEKFRERIGFSIEYKRNFLEELIYTDSLNNRGIILPYIQNKVIELSERSEINLNSDSSLARLINVFKKKPVGVNALIGFLDHYKEKHPADDLFYEIKKLLSVPYFEVLEVQEDEECETIDIALDHQDHDFVASGLITHNTNPCYIYCMDSNSVVNNVNVIAHAIGHNDFFKNNIFFEPTDENMMNKLANHGTRIRRYMSRWGYEVVTEFIDHCLRLETLIDPNKAWKKKKIKDAVVRDDRKYIYPERRVSKNNYMDEWVNSKKEIDQQNEIIKRKEASNFLDLFSESCKDILGFLKDNAPLKPWQQDIISMLYDEAMYFSPQRSTKMINEGWASFVDYHILCRMGLVSLGQKTEDSGIWQYSEHKMHVLGGKYSQNPYKVGFELLLDIEDRWNKGKFGSEYENCNDIEKKSKWNLNLNLGMEKLFEVRKNYNDFLIIQEFFTPEFCEKNKFFEWRKFPNGEYVIVNKDHKIIKKKLLQKYLNAGLPDIRLLDPNHQGKGWFYMEHQWDGRPLHDSYARETIVSVQKIWGNVVILSTKNKHGVEYIYVCDGSSIEKNVQVLEREEYEKRFLI